MWIASVCWGDLGFRLHGPHILRKLPRAAALPLENVEIVNAQFDRIGAVLRRDREFLCIPL